MDNAGKSKSPTRVIFLFICFTKLRITKLHYEQDTAQTDWGEHSKFSAENYTRPANNDSFVIQNAKTLLQDREG